MFIKPPYLQAGDVVAVVAPAGIIADREDIHWAIAELSRWGLTVKAGRHLFAEYSQYAGTDEQRSADVQAALDDPEIKAIFFARGGYGTVRLIDSLDFTAFEKRPKWLVGFSDLTVIHAHVHRCFQVATLHGPMPVTFRQMVKNNGLQPLKDCLFGKTYNINVSPHALNIQGETSGILTGGNLSVLMSIAGSVSDVDMADKILFMEDVGEYLYHLDRMMMFFKRSGKLSALKGLLVGSFTEMKDKTLPYGKSAEEIIYEHTAAYGYPVLFNFPAGHGDQNLPLVFGAVHHMKTDASTALLELQ